MLSSSSAPFVPRSERAGCSRPCRWMHARQAASIGSQSEHVARVIDVGTHKGLPYLVMELLQGEDLGQMIERGVVLSPAQAVDLLLQACEGLAEAHALGIVHRDIKPRNLFLTQRVHGGPLLKILDFGLAKSMVGGAGDGKLTALTTIMWLRRGSGNRLLHTTAR